MDHLLSLVHSRRTVHLLNKSGLNVAMTKDGCVISNDSGSVTVPPEHIEALGKLLDNVLVPLLARDAPTRSR